MGQKITSSGVAGGHPIMGAPWGPHPRGRSRAGPQQDSFASKIIQIAEN